MRTAIVHEWLPVYAGAERVLEQLLHVFPAARLFSLLEFLPPDQRAFLGGREVETSFMQRLPLARRCYRYYLPLAPLAIEQFDLQGHDVVVSQSYAVAKGVLTTCEQLHVSYVCTPMRYAWDLYFEYLRQGGLERGPRSLLARAILHYLRLYDVVTAPRVDVYVANSAYVARRIEKTYRREAHVVHPPVDVAAFDVQHDKDDYYLTVSRLVPYKRIDVLVDAFNAMPGRRLVVVGDGPGLAALRRRAGPGVEVLGYQPTAEVRRLMAGARAFVFAAREDFGIVPVEAQACGTPVIAFAAGGVLETVVPGVTGLFFDRQEPEAVVDAVARFERQRERFEPERLRAHAEQFGAARFRRSFAALVDEAWTAFCRDGPPTAALPRAAGRPAVGAVA